MQLVPSQDEVIQLLRATGGLRHGHFEYPSGLHAAHYLQLALTMRSYSAAKTLSVGLSRKVRTNAEIRALIPELSIVAPATGGLPVAYGVCEALRAKQVYWGEAGSEAGSLRLRQYLEVHPGEKILLVDDILRTGRKLRQLKDLVESKGGEVVGLAVMVLEPFPNSDRFDGIPMFYLARLDHAYYGDSSSCDECVKGTAVEKIWV